MLRQEVRNGDLDGAMKKLSQRVAKDGLLSGLKKKKYYVSPHKAKKQKAEENKRKNSRRNKRRHND